MKKFVSLVMALAMVCALSVSAMADSVNIEADNTSGSAPVKVKVDSGTNGGTKYYVTVEWTDLTFTYQKEGAGTWNETTHSYDGSTANTWVTEGNDQLSGDKQTITRPDAVTVKNHSNAMVYLKATAPVNGEFTWLSAAVTGGKESLASAVGHTDKTGATPETSDDFDHEELTAKYTLALTATEANVPENLVETPVGNVVIAISSTPFS